MSFDPWISEWGNPPSTIRIVTAEEAKASAVVALRIVT